MRSLLMSLLTSLLPLVVALTLVAVLVPAAPGGAMVTTADKSPVEQCLAGTEGMPVGLGSCPGVRPGAAVRTDIGTCTFNYVVQGVPQEGPTRTLIGTAGHCVIDTDGERTWAPGVGPVARNGAGEIIGRAVYAVLGAGRDYALIEPSPGMNTNPAMCHFGGPTAHAEASSDTYVVLQHSGQATGLSSIVPGRSHLARRFDDPHQVRFDGPASFGDSGAPVARAGRAVGIIVTIGADLGGTVRALRLRPQLERAGQVLQLRMSLVTAT